MADIPYGGPRGAVAPDQAAAPQGAGQMQTLGTLTNWAGAAVSLALIVGIGVWGYKTLSRDVSGVPIVRAASGAPMRVQPDEPGGRPAMHQGLAVNRVAAEGAAERPADRLVLAPAPVSLDDEDGPGRAGTLAAVQADTPAPDGELQAVTAPSKTPQETPQMASIRALADRLSGQSAPLGEVAPAPQASVETIQPAAAVGPAAVKPAHSAAAASPVKAVVKGGLKQSLRPRSRPGVIKAAAAAVPASKALEINVRDIPAGTKLAQLGAFDSPETARREWDKLNARFGDYLEGKQRVIQKAKSGGRVFYRLRAMGFADLSDARRFCSALVAERADCIPVSTK